MPPEPGVKERLATLEEQQEEKTRTLMEHSLKMLTLETELKAIHEWQIRLKGQLSIWKWITPMLTSIVSSVLTGVIISVVTHYFLH